MSAPNGWFISRGVVARLAFIVVVTCFLFTGCGATAPNVISPASSDWEFQFSSGMPDHPAQTGEGMWHFDFPDNPGHVGYITVPYHQTSPHQSITMTFRVDASGAVAYNGNLSADNNCVIPATVRLYFQKANDDLATDGNRWWSNPSSYQLGSTDGSVVTLTVPLTPDKWSTVFGEFGNDSPETQAWFAGALQDLAHVGMTFGGGCFFGHGVNVSGGPARFTLLDFSIS